MGNRSSMQKIAWAMPSWTLQNVVITPRMVELVVETWTACMSGKTAPFLAAKSKDETLTPLVFFYNNFYYFLFELLPEVKPLFHRGIQQQGKMLANVIKYIVTNLSEKDERLFVSNLTELTKIHNARGITADHYSVMGMVLVHTVRLCMGFEQFREEHKQAWVMVYSKMMSVIIPVVVSGALPDPEQDADSKNATDPNHPKKRFFWREDDSSKSGGTSKGSHKDSIKSKDTKDGHATTVNTATTTTTTTTTTTATTTANGTAAANATSRVSSSSPTSPINRSPVVPPSRLATRNTSLANGTSSAAGAATMTITANGSPGATTTTNGVHGAHDQPKKEFHRASSSHAHGAVPATGTLGNHGNHTRSNSFAAAHGTAAPGAASVAAAATIAAHGAGGAGGESTTATGSTCPYSGATGTGGGCPYASMHAGATSNGGTAAFVSKRFGRLARAILVAERMEKELQVGDHVLGFRHYKNSFLGHDALKWMMSTGVCSSRDDAVMLANVMVKASLICEVSTDDLESPAAACFNDDLTSLYSFETIELYQDTAESAAHFKPHKKEPKEIMRPIPYIALISDSPLLHPATGSLAAETLPNQPTL